MPTTLYTARLIIVIPEAFAATANTWLADKEWAGETPASRSRTFTVQLSPTGNLPATHR